MVFLLLGCAPEDGGSLTKDELTWWQDVRPVVESNCVGCHDGEGIGSFPLETYEDVVLVKSAVRDAVVERRMPPWLAGPDCTEYRDDISLSDEEILVIADWIDAGAPEGDPADAAPSEVPEFSTLEDPDVVLELPAVYTPTQAPDDYRCFVVDWPLDETVYVTGYHVLPGNEKVVHHLIAYIVDPQHVEFYEALDAEEPGAGYTCFGSPGAPDGMSQGAIDWLGGWAPGGGYSPFPEGVGIEMKPDAKVVLQVHYNLEGVELGEQDRTQMLLEVEDEVENQVIIQPWTDTRWLDSERMEIPAESEGTTYSFGYTMPIPLTIYTANLHMHTLGRSGRMYLDRADDSEECMLDIPRWDFNWQRGYKFVEPKEVQAGDAIVVECTWDNPTDQDVYWGEGTSDEMCLGTMLVGW